MKDSKDLTADAIALLDEQLVLVERYKEPEGLALPGGHYEPGETLVDTAIREMQEETGLYFKPENIVGVYDDPERDPRGEKISVVYAGEACGEISSNESATDVNTVPFSEVESVVDDLVFDHDEIVQDFLDGKGFPIRNEELPVESGDIGSPVDQEYLDETADELSFYADEIENHLEMHEAGHNEGLEKLVERANRTYEELEKALEDVERQRNEQDLVENFGEILEEHGYTGSDFIAGVKPITADDEDPERQVFEDLKGINWPDTERAHDARRRYNSVRKTAFTEHGLELTKPDIEINPEHQETLELVRNGMSKKKAKRKVREEPSSSR